MKRLIWATVALAALLLAANLDRFRREIDRVVIVTVDTMRVDHIPYNGYPRPTATFLMQIADEGFSFDRSYSASPDLPLALSALASSRHPAAAAPVRRPSMLRPFRKAGFDVAAFTDDPRIGAVVDDPVSALKDLDSAIDAAIGWYRDGSRGRKAAVWIHLNGLAESRRPCPLDRLAPIGRELREFLVARQGLPATGGQISPAAVERARLHDARIYAVDRALSRFYWRVLERKQPTLWVITSLRGEALDAADDGRRLDEGLLRVPLIFWFSDDRGPGRRFGRMARHLEVLPSLAELALPAPARWKVSAEGRSVASSLRKKGDWVGVSLAYARRPSGAESLSIGRHKVVRQDGRASFFDIYADPLERRPLDQAAAGMLGGLLRRLDRLR